jgi:hypothetical protein
MGPIQPAAPRLFQRSLVARALRLAVPAVAIALAATAAAVGPSWFSAQPRAFQRAAIEILLQAILIVYGMVVLFAVAGTPLLGWLLARRWRRGQRRAALERGLLVCMSCLAAIVGLEVLATGWRAWIHRIPILPTTFAPSPPGEYRIVVLGGSAALGEPYRPWVSVGQIVAWKLQEAIPDRRFVCQILAWLGDSLEKQHVKLAGLKQKPGAVIIYSGHNEFAARFGEERDPWLGWAPRSSLFRQLELAAMISPFCRLCHEVKNANRIDAPPLAGRHHLIDPPICGAWEKAEIVAEFGRRLEAIVAYCERIGALPILIVPPANEAGYEPSRSTLPPDVPKSEPDRLAAEFAHARGEESRDPAASAARYEAILARHPQFAEAHFRLARLLEHRGRFGLAAEHYLAALDCDGLPIRCPAALRAAYVQVSQRHPACVLIDGRREMAATSANGLIGDEMIQDTHHPTLRGYVTLASAVLRALAQRPSFEGRLAVTLPLDVQACGARFAMGPDQWATVCERTAEHYRRVAGYRYDPTERLDKARRYAALAVQFRAWMKMTTVEVVGRALRML